MGRKTGELSHDLKARRKALLRRYDAEELHQLRVNIRRLRSVLKLAATEKARRLRKTWGTLARRTNAARDWDTFAEYIRATLDPALTGPLQPLLALQLEQAHRRVEKTLLSPRWTEACKAWQVYERHRIAAPTAVPALASQVEPARRRANQASAAALSRNDQASWHALRIAIKELRYTLDNLQPGSPAEQRQLRAGIGLCKQLQSELGDWHDTVVHRELAEQLAQAAAGDAAAVAAIRELVDCIHRRGVACLEAARETLAANAHLLAPPQEGGLALGYEIEKKFLVDPALLGELEDGERMVQGFVPTRSNAVVRARLAGEQAWLTLKGPSRDGVRSEFEYPIPPEDARHILQELCTSPVITKTRYRREFAGFIWEIDVFEGENAGLIVAEVELGSATDEPELPPWVTAEVTGDMRYHNVNLARHPFSEWGRTEQG